jgi:RHS repeat-associated protein
LSYTYDPVGNITTIQDAAQQTVYFDGQITRPVMKYTYDPLYRLITAVGREHIGQTTSQPPETNPGLKPQYDSNDWTRRNLPHPHQAEAMRNYTESYEYDGVGNILAMIHQAAGGAWNRRYDYEATNNRLRTTSLPGDGDDVKLLPSRYSYDEHGNMTRMPHLPLMRWDFKDQLQATSQQVRNDAGTPEITYFVYDASGQRVRKVTERQADAGQVPTRMKERIYLGGFELYREYSGDGSTVTLERETLHIMDDKRRIALVETKIVDAETPVVGDPQPVIRYQLYNHLGSASLELDGAGQVISYEEYYPYGTTSYQAGRSVAEVSLKRYRYTGKERDEETGLAYHGARYYAPWLGRWVSCDPIGIKDGLNIYSYVRGNPILRKDLTGTVGTCNSAIASCDEPNATISTEGINNRSSENDRAVDKLNDDNVVAFQALKDGKASLSKFDTAKWRKDVDAKLQQHEKERVIAAGIKVARLEEEARQQEEAKVEKDLPGAVGSAVPLYGSGKSSYVHFSHGNYGRGALYGALAISDIFLVKSLIVGGGKLALKIAGSSALREGESVAAGLAVREVATPALLELPEVTIRYTPKMAASPSDANFLRLSLEWAQTEVGSLARGERLATDASYRAAARRSLTSEGVDLAGRDAMHPLDSVAAGGFQAEGQGTTYYFGNSSVNRSYGGQLGNGLKRAGVEVGERFRINFVGFPSYELAPAIAPPASIPNLAIRYRF